MYYKLSNTAERDQIEKQYRVRFLYPNLYRPEIIINGLGEATLPIITNEQQDKISLAIWGILPEDYNEDWSSFQDATNTLNIEEKMLDTSSWYREAFGQRKCLIVVTGFFCHFLQNGTIYPYYISLPTGKSFLLAGIYNRLNDGFLTCSFLTGSADAHLRQFHNLGDSMPIIIPDKMMHLWLDNEISLEGLRNHIAPNPISDSLKAVPIAKDLFKKNITYDSMLNPSDYPDIPKDEDFI